MLGPGPPPGIDEACKPQLEEFNTTTPKQFEARKTKGPILSERLRMPMGNIVRAVGCVIYKTIDGKIHRRGRVASIYLSFMQPNGQPTKTQIINQYDVESKNDQ